MMSNVCEEEEQDDYLGNNRIYPNMYTECPFCLRLTLHCMLLNLTFHLLHLTLHFCHFHLREGMKIITKFWWAISRPKCRVPEIETNSQWNRTQYNYKLKAVQYSISKLKFFLYGHFRSLIFFYLKIVWYTGQVLHHYFATFEQYQDFPRIFPSVNFEQRMCERVFRRLP